MTGRRTAGNSTPATVAHWLEQAAVTDEVVRLAVEER